MINEKYQIMNRKTIMLINLLFTLVILASFVIASDTIPVYKSDVELEGDYLVPGWERLPFKHQKASLSWVQSVNSELNPTIPWSESNYDSNNEKTAPVCLSYAAATVNDWFMIQTGDIFRQYQNFYNNRTENGTNPRELAAIYYWRNGDNAYDQSLYDYVFLPDAFEVANENIPYDIKGYADIIINPPSDWQNHNDPNLGANYQHTVTPEEYLDSGSPGMV